MNASPHRSVHKTCLPDLSPAEFLVFQLDVEYVEYEPVFEIEFREIRT